MNKHIKTIVAALCVVIVFLIGLVVGVCVTMTVYDTTETTETISFPKNDTVYFHDTIYFQPQ
jgi:hypothetical protein